MVAPDRLLEVCDRGVSVLVEAAVWWDSRITFGPKLTLEGSLADPPRPEHEAIRLKPDFATLRRPVRHTSSLSTRVHWPHWDGPCGSCDRLGSMARTDRIEPD